MKREANVGRSIGRAGQRGAARKALAPAAALIGAVMLSALLFPAGRRAIVMAAENTAETPSSSWALRDGLGRVATENYNEYPEKTDKKVAIFYHLWHKNFTQASVNLDREAPRNVTRILTGHPEALKDSSLWGPEISYHYWGEPLLGYYDAAVDEFVLRAHARMLCDAGVDAIFIDYTNFFGNKSENAYTKPQLTRLLDTFAQIRAEGGRTPQVAMLLTWDAASNGKATMCFYEDFYTGKNAEKYDELWFRWKGRPLILGHGTVNVSFEAAAYFTFRAPHPFYTPVTAPESWPWLSIYPQQPAYTADDPCEAVAVSVAQNWSTSLDFMSAADAEGRFIARGRSYTEGGNNKLLADPVSPEYGSEYGANFAQQFERAIALDPELIFVTGWNEWIAARFLTIPDWARCAQDPVPPFGGFCDVFCSEFSRDIEPTRDGGLDDHFYNQLAEYVRKFKGVTPQARGGAREIDIDGPLSQWEDVGPAYTDGAGKLTARSARGIGSHKYENLTGRNDIVLAKVTYDADNVYFYAETAAPLSPYTDPDRMVLYLAADPAAPNWEGFDLVLNRTGVTGSRTTLERSRGGFDWETVSADIRYREEGNRLHIVVPAALLGLDTASGDFTFCFKWADNTAASGDPLDFYQYGDVAPGERFMYRFAGENYAGMPGSAGTTERKSLSAAEWAVIGASGALAAGAVAAAVAVTVKRRNNNE